MPKKADTKKSTAKKKASKKIVQKKTSAKKTPAKKAPTKKKQGEENVPKHQKKSTENAVCFYNAHPWFCYSLYLYVI